MAIEGFELHLASGLEALANSSSSYLSLPWIEEALQLVSQMQNYVVAYVQQALRDEDDPDWLRRCIVDADKLLQVCGILIRSIADIRYYQMFVQLAMQAVESKQRLRAQQLLNSCIQGLANDAEQETSRLSLQRARLDKCKQMLLSILEGEAQALPHPHSKSCIFKSTLKGMRTAAIFVLLVLAAGLTVRPKPKPSSLKPPVYTALDKRKDSTPGQEQGQQQQQQEQPPPWLDPLMRLYQSVTEEVVSRRADFDCRQQQPFAFLHELDKVDESVRELRAQILNDGDDDDHIASVDKCVAQLRESVHNVEAALPCVEMHINGISRILTSSRTIALQLLYRCQTNSKPSLKP